MRKKLTPLSLIAGMITAHQHIEIDPSVLVNHTSERFIFTIREF